MGLQRVMQILVSKLIYEKTESRTLKIYQEKVHIILPLWYHSPIQVLTALNILIYWFLSIDLVF